MDLSVIFDAIVPDNIKNLPLVKICSDIFIKQLNRNSQVSLNIRKLFDIDNNKFIESDNDGNITEITDSKFLTESKEFLKLGLFYTYINNVIYLIVKLQRNNVINRDLIKEFNSEYFGELREYQRYVGTEKAIKYMYAFAKYLETGTIVRDLTLEQGSLFELRYDGSLPNDIFTVFNKQIAHPCGWLCEYEKLGIPPEPEPPTPPEPPVPVEDNLILDCDFDDGDFEDKKGNYNLSDFRGNPDINGNTWFTTDTEIEFGDYHYDCDPDMSIPVISEGGSDDDSELINPYQIWILAEGWDNLWVETNSYSAIKLNKLNGYFIYNTIYTQYENFVKFYDSLIVEDRTKSTLAITSNTNPQNYYGKIIKITENSDTIEVMGDIYA